LEFGLGFRRAALDVVHRHHALDGGDGKAGILELLLQQDHLADVVQRDAAVRGAERDRMIQAELARSERDCGSATGRFASR
jgi:hypothetical protein